MIILNYQKKRHKQIINACVLALKQGKVVAYPTDTCYGLAVDATDVGAIKKLYRVKQRPSRLPIHIVVPSVAYAKKIVKWNQTAQKLTDRFWPGALTLVLGLRAKRTALRTLSAGIGTIGIRFPKNQIALDLAKYLKSPITTTSANVSGKKDNYSADDILAQFKEKRYKPDIIINAGRLVKRKPSTIVKITPPLIPPLIKGGRGGVEILRQGSISLKQIILALRTEH